MHSQEPARVGAIHESPLLGWFSVFLCFGILTAGWWVTPQNVTPIPLCFFKLFFHLPCPGCGLTRSFLSMARGHLSQAIAYNWAGPLIYLLFVAYLADSLLRLFNSSRRVTVPLWLGRFYAASVAGLLLAHWIFVLFFD